MNGRTVAVVRRCRKCWGEYVQEPSDPLPFCERCFWNIWTHLALEVVAKEVHAVGAVNRQFDWHP
jgi:hypothetical protein